MSRFDNYQLTFTTDGDSVEIDVAPIQIGDPDEGTKGHLYSLEGVFTLGDLGALAELLRRHEAPNIGAREWSNIRNDDRRTLTEGDS